MVFNETGIAGELTAIRNLAIGRRKLMRLSLLSSASFFIKSIIDTMNILFVSGFGPIVNDISASKQLYIDTLNLPLKEESGYYQSESIEGVKHFGLWPLSQAATSCFGNDNWPADIFVPASWIEYEVQDVEEATVELLEKGYSPLVKNKTEPWGQIVTRFLSPEGILTSVTYSPWFHEEK